MKFILILIILTRVNVFAGEKTIKSDMENYSAIGYSENPSEQLAKQDACNAARRELIGHVFGAAYQINQNMIRSIGVLDYSQDVSVNTGEIIIRGAITETEVSHGTTKCTITYPIQEAKLERERLKSSGDFKNTQFTDVGGANETKGGVLEIVTIPDDADVYIDNQRWGTTPLRLNSKLSFGLHVIRIEHENYKTIEISKEIGALAKTRIEEILRRATGKLKVVTNPPGATVMIDGQNVGLAPTNEIEILSGRKAKIEVTHPETDSMTQIVSVGRDEERALNLTLQMKPSAFSVHINPIGASIRLDNDKSVPADQWISTYSGTHNLEVTMDGYEDYSAPFDLRGGEKKTLSTINLRSISKEKERHLKNGPPWSLGISFGVSQSPLKNIDPQLNQKGILVKYQISYLFSFEVLGITNTGTTNYSDATLNLSGNQMLIGFPIRMYQSDNTFVSRFSISPEYSSIFSKYSAEYKTTGSSSPQLSITQSGYGLSAIWTLFTKSQYQVGGYFIDFRMGIMKFQNYQTMLGETPKHISVMAGVTW